MFDFDHWCRWAQVEANRVSHDALAVELHRGKASPKAGAVVNFESDNWLLQFSFWVTGESDFFGVDRANQEDIIYFSGRVIDDTSFERTFNECLATASAPPVRSA